MASRSSSPELKALKERVHDAVEGVRDLHTLFDTYWEFYGGRQDQGISPEDWQQQDMVAVNVVLAHTETRVPILNDATPIWYVVAPENGNEEQETALTEALQALWHARRVGQEYKMSLRDQLVVGTGFLKAWWDPKAGPEQLSAEGDALEAAGDVNVSWLDPYSVHPDPFGRNLEECSYIALSHDLPADRAEILWPKGEEGDGFDKDDAEIVAEDSSNRRTILDVIRAWWGKLTGQNRASGRNIYRIWEVYHDFGRLLTIYSGENVIFDGDNPTPGGKYPFVKFTTYARGYDFWGLAETSQIIGLQQQLNLSFTRMNSHWRLMGSPGWITDDPMFLADNKPGGVSIIQQPGKMAKVREIASIPQWAFQLVQLYREAIDLITGVHDVTRGLRPGGVQSGIGIQYLQETALTRLRDLSRDNAVWLEDLGQLVLRTMQERYEGPRSIPYMKGSERARATVTPEMLRGTAAPEEGQEGAEGQEFPIELRVVVQPGADLPLNNMARMELALQLARIPGEDAKPLIDREAVLEETSFHRRREVLDRFSQRSQAEMEGQLAALEQQGSPGVRQPPLASGSPVAPPTGAPQTPEQGTVSLDQLAGLLGPEQIAMLQQIVEDLRQGLPLDQVEQDFLASLSPQLAELVAQYLAAEGVQPPPGMIMMGTMPGQPPSGGAPLSYLG